MIARLDLSFKGKSIPEIIARVGMVCNALADHPDFQKPSDLAPSLAELKEAGEGLREALELTAAGDKTKVPQREAAKKDVTNKLIRIGRFLQLKAGDNVQELTSKGFDVLRRNSSANRGPLTAPANFTVKNLDHEGVVIAKATPVKGAICYEVHVTDGDPTVDTNWRHEAVFGSCTHMTIDTLTSCRKYSLRVRAITRKERSPWSSQVSMVVT